MVLEAEERAESPEFRKLVGKIPVNASDEKVS